MSRSSRLVIVAGAAMLVLTLQPAFANHTPTHTKAQISKLNKKIKQRYTKAQVDELLAAKADVGDSYTTTGSDERYRRYERTIVVPTGGTHAQNGAALQSAVAAISGAAPDNGYVLLLEPGRYDLGSTPLVLPDYVSLLGSGRRNTMITCACGGTLPAASATLVTGLAAEVRSLEVENVDTDLRVYGINAGGDGVAEVRISDVHVHVSGGPSTDDVIGIRDPDKPIRIRDVEVQAVGGAISYTGIAIGSLTGGTVAAEVTDVTAFAQTTENYTSGIRLLNADASIDGGRFTASDALDNYAIYTQDSEALVRGVHADATGGGDRYYAIFARNSDVRVIGSVLDATGQEAYGVMNRIDQTGVFLVTVDSSTIRTDSTLFSGKGVQAERVLGAGTSVLVVDGSQIRVDPGDAVARAGSGGIILVGGTLMSGGDNLTSGGTIICTAARDENGAFFAETCPTDPP